MHARSWLAATALFAVLAVAHAQVASAGLAASGPLLVADHLYNAALVVGLLAVLGALGRRILRAAGVEASAPVDGLLPELIVGAGAVATANLALGLAGLLSPATVLAVLVVSGWAGRREIAETPGRVATAVRSVPRSVWITAALLGGVLLLRALAPPTDWDSLMYHLHLPRRFLEEGRVFVPADTHHVAFTGLVHMLYVPLLALGSATAPALLGLAFALLLPLAVHRLARRLVGSGASEMAGIAIWGTTTVALVAVTARVDVTLLLFLVVAHTALHRALTGDRATGALVLAGVLLGLAVGVKYQGAAYALALAPVVAWTAIRGGPEGGRGGRAVLLVAAGAAAAALPWFARNGLLLEAPFYPFLADRLLPRWLAELHGSRTVPASVDPAVFGALGEVRRPFDVLAAFFRPERLSVEGEAAHYHLSPLLLLLPAWLAWIRDRGLAWLVVPALGYVALVLGASPRTNLRYLLPAVPALTVASCALAVRVTERAAGLVGGGSEDGGDAPPSRAGPGLGRRSRRWAVGLAVLSLLPTVLGLAAWLPGEVSLPHLAGAESRSTYLSERRNPALVARAGLTDFGERPVPDDARVLLMFEAREFYFSVPSLQDPVLANWALLRPVLSDGRCLEGTGVTHVLVGTGVLEYYLRRGLDPRTVRWPSFRDFARRCLRTALVVPGFRLYRTDGFGRRGDGD